MSCRFAAPSIVMPSSPSASESSTGVTVSVTPALPVVLPAGIAIFFVVGFQAGV
ncbi:MAG: hypothetical protein OXF97_04280 [Nitrospira sp.]|nr:hypothetical protein [Nitrospira sp.]